MDENRLICRMCLQCNDLVHIFSDNIKSSSLWTKINVHLGQEVSEDDELPEFICLKCIKIVCDFDLFCIQVTENQEVLRRNFTIIHLDDGTEKGIEMKSEFVVGKNNVELDVGNSVVLISNDGMQANDENETIKSSDVCDEASNDSSQIVWHSMEEEYILEEDDISCDDKKDNKMLIIPSPVKSEQNIPEHVRSVIQQYPRTIMKDGRYTVNRTKLVEMMQNFFLLKCQLCLGKASRARHKTITGLFNHYRRWHKVQGYVTCCDRKFRKRSEIVFHMIWHLQPSAFKCSVCGKRVTDPKKLVRHMRSHKDQTGSEKQERKTRCDECGVKVLSEHFLEIHKNKVHNSEIKLPEADMNEPHPDFEGFPRSIMKNGEVAIRGERLTELINKFYRFVCDMCPESKTFPSFSVLSEHYKNVHCAIGYAKCCGIKIEKRISLIHHMAQHLDPDAFKCPICGKMKSRPRKLKEHMMIHKSVEERWYFCPQCPKRYITHVGLEKHMINHLPIEKRKKFPCGTCGKIFYHRTSLNSHVKSAHTDENLICHVCGKHLKREWAYKAHMETHNPDRMKKSNNSAPKKRKPRTKTTRKRPQKMSRPALEEWRICPYCSQIFLTKRLLLEHAEIEHNFLHKCEHCNYSNTKFELYLRHVNEQHVLGRDFVCHICGVSYEYSYKLKDHMNVHTRDKKYTCQFCNKEYLSLSGFCRHGRENHAEEYKQFIERKKKMRRLKKVQTKQTQDEHTDDTDFSVQAKGAEEEPFDDADFIVFDATE